MLPNGSSLSFTGSLGSVALGRYRIDPGEPLGQGGFCVVWRGEDDVQKRSVAVKTYRPQREREDGVARLAEKFRKEIETFRKLGLSARDDSTTVPDAALETRRLFVNLLDFSAEAETGEPAITTNGRFYTILELASCSLDAWLDSREMPAGGASLPLIEAAAEVLGIGRAVASALNVLHSQNLVHLDVKPENVMLFGDDWKLIDLEGMQPCGDGGQVTTDCFTPLYASPELASFVLEKLDAGTAVDNLAGFELTAALDNWAFGVLLLDIAVRRRALDDNFSSLQFSSLFDGDEEPPFASWYRWLSDPAPLDLHGLVPACSPGGVLLRASGPDGDALRSLLGGLVQKDPSIRIVAAEALRHPAMRLAPPFEAAPAEEAGLPQPPLRESLRLQDIRAAYAHTLDNCSLSKIADHQFSIGPKDLEASNLSSDEQELVRGTSFSWFKPDGDLKQVVVMLHGWSLVMNPNTLGDVSTASGQEGLASLVSAGYDVVLPELPANPRALGSSRDVKWAQGVCGPTDVGTYKNPANHRKMAAYLEALFRFFDLAGGVHKPIVIAPSYSGYFVSAWLIGLDKEDGKPRNENFAALILLAGATIAEGDFLTNYEKKPVEQSEDELSTVDERNWKELTDHQVVFTRPLQQSLERTPVLYMRGSNDQLFPASAAAYLGLELKELQMIRCSSDHESFGEVNYVEKPLYRWEANRKSGYAPKIMAVLKDAPHALFFLEKAGTLQPLRDEINLFLQQSLDEAPSNAKASLDAKKEQSSACQDVVKVFKKWDTIGSGLIGHAELLLLAGYFGLSADQTKLLIKAAIGGDGGADAVERGNPVNYVNFLEFVFSDP